MHILLLLIDTRLHIAKVMIPVWQTEAAWHLGIWGPVGLEVRFM